MWLSTLENSKCSAKRFASTWEWICHYTGGDDLAHEWRLALERLRVLGHIERDFTNQAVHVAPAALVGLPSADGIYLLTGARPTGALRRLFSSADDDEAVARAAQLFLPFRRTQTDPRTHRPLGPTTLYLAPQPGAMGRIAEGLEALGIEACDVKPADGLLEALPAPEQIVQYGTTLTISPSSRFSVWRRDHGLRTSYTWRDASDDAAPGLYQYRTTYGTKIHAWRPKLMSDLVLLPDVATGKWMDEVRENRRTHLKHNQGKRLLFAPVALGLPHLVKRSLVLRTGFQPTKRALGGQGDVYYVYENVGPTAASRVAQLLGQDLQNSTDGECA